ncbi:MAG: hypothetical protein AB200_00080 [Parcubacteria bacterium C7867-005]|nr:MAG: hypothetical protein AB200_00080 [Parcubacteria bacterium C7867-005]
MYYVLITKGIIAVLDTSATIDNFLKKRRVVMPV